VHSVIEKVPILNQFSNKNKPGKSKKDEISVVYTSFHAHKFNWAVQTVFCKIWCSRRYMPVKWSLHF